MLYIGLLTFFALVSYFHFELNLQGQKNKLPIESTWLRESSPESVFNVV